jgi:transposase
MGRPYSADLRDRVRRHIEAGHSRREASRHFGVSASFAVKLARRVAVSGSMAPARQGRPPGDGKLQARIDKIIAWVEAEPDITMRACGQAAGGGRAGPVAVAAAVEGGLLLQKKH